MLQIFWLKKLIISKWLKKFISFFLGGPHLYFEWTIYKFIIYIYWKDFKILRRNMGLLCHKVSPPLGSARISSFFPKLMWSEGFSIMGSPVEHASQLWPKIMPNSGMCVLHARLSRLTIAKIIVHIYIYLRQHLN